MKNQVVRHKTRQRNNHAGWWAEPEKSSTERKTTNGTHRRFLSNEKLWPKILKRERKKKLIKRAGAGFVPKRQQPDNHRGTPPQHTQKCKWDVNTSRRGKLSGPH